MISGSEGSGCGDVVGDDIYYEEGKCERLSDTLLMAYEKSMWFLPILYLGRS